GEQPGQDLPVPAGPAVLPPGIGGVEGREVVEQLDIGHQTAARVGALNEIVAEDVVFRKRLPDRRLGGIDVVNPLAGVRAAAEQILVDVGNGGRIRIEADRAREEAREQRTGGGHQAEADERLQDAVTTD